MRKYRNDVIMFKRLPKELAFIHVYKGIPSGHNLTVGRAGH